MLIAFATSILALAPLSAPQSGLPAPQSGAETMTWSGSELARLAAVEPANGHLVLGSGESAVLELYAPLAFRSAGVWWQGGLGEAWLTVFDAQGAELAFAPLVEAEDLAPEIAGSHRPAGGRRVSGLVHSYGGAGAGVRLVLTGPVDLAELTLVAIPVPARVPEPPAVGQAGLAGAYPKPAVWSREAWGAAPPTCSFAYCSTTHIAVHHSASSSDFLATTWNDCADNVKAIQTYHQVTNGWCDVGYNYLVCVHGDLFEGRDGGDDVKGAHDGFNCGSMGACLMGYFHGPFNQVPSPAMIDALEELGAWKCDQQGIAPLGSGFYSGYGGVVENVYGHRDVKATACPGDLAYDMLPAIRAGVAGKLAGGGTGTLLGILYDATLGTSAHVAGGTVALADGSFTTTSASGLFSFELSAGTYSFAATAPGFAPGSSTETVTSGDVWESLGLVPASLPAHTVTATGPNTFLATFEVDPGSPIYLGYAARPSVPPANLGAIGVLWPDLATFQVAFLGFAGPASTASALLQAPPTPGLVFHSQGYLLWNGQPRLTNGAAFRTE